MNETKIRLSPKEAELIVNADWILTKNEIIKKIKHLFGKLTDEQHEVLESPKLQLPPEVLAPAPKISRGENYKGLPYLVLDHPRCFDKENVFAIRTMFWWGNHFSTTLQLSGRYKKLYEQPVLSAYQLLKKKNVFCCTSDDPWEHHFEKSNYAPVKECTEAVFKKNILEKKFIKLAKKIPVQNWDNAPVQLMNDFRFFTGITVSASGQLPSR